MRSGKAIIWSLLILILAANLAQSQDYGLQFASYDSLKDKRTGINLFPDRSPTIRDNFELSFDISIHDTESFNFGYVFRTILNENHNIDLLYRLTGGQDNFNIVNKQEQTNIVCEIDHQTLYDQWVTLRIQFLLSEDKIICYWQDDTLVHEKAGMENPAKVNIFFGANSENKFTTTEVPPINIKDIKIAQKSKPAYHWPLDDIRGSTASESLKKQDARVYNPIWLKMLHMEWKHTRHFILDGSAKIIPDHRANKLYLLGQKNLVTYDLVSGTIDTIPVAKNPFLFLSHYQAAFDGRFILSYNPDSRQLIKIDPKSGKVNNNIDSLSTRKNFLHHNKYIDTLNHLLYLLNGYGHYNYHNELIQCNIENNTWTRLKGTGDIYAPRYLAASGFLNDTIYILGGYGSHTGDQRLNPRYYYDLNTISLNNFNYSTKWEYDIPENDFCFANSMVIDSATRKFYALSFPKHRFESQLQLVEGSLDHKGLIKIGDPFPYYFNDINSYADLYFFNDLKKLIAVTLYTKDYTNSSIEIYSLHFPPLIEEEAAVSGASMLTYILYFLLVLILIGLVLVIWKQRRKKRSVKRKNGKVVPLDSKGSTPSKNAILFFGGFQVLNRDGEDITKKFTRLIKELFLYILFKSISNSKGVSSDKLIELLWFDKDTKSGRNNLSVNVAKIKDILKQVDGCMLDHGTGYWKLIIDRDLVFAEYLEILKAVETNEKKLSLESLVILLDAANRGPFLVNLEYEWLDKYKGEVSDRIVDTLISHAESLDPKKESALIIQIANSVFNFDTINEEAMVLKCRTQRILGKHSLSRKTYEEFCKEYKVLYGEPFNRPFQSIINEE